MSTPRTLRQSIMGRPRRTLLMLSLVLTLVLVLRWSTATGAPVSPEGHVFRQRLVAVGDLHGDFDHAQKVLRMAKIIDGRGNWAGGNDIFVQTGDIVDRGAYALDIYKMMQRLRGEAAAQGGKVVSILGNHEVMNALGDWRYVTPGDISRFGGVAARQAAMSTDGWLGKEWLDNYAVTARVPLSPFPNAPSLSFTHGSLRPSYPDLLPYPKKINDLGHALLSRALRHPPPPYPPNPYPGFPDGTTDAEMELYNADGPLWWRGLAEAKDENVVCTWARQLQNKLGVRRVIGGHTPTFERIVDRCNASIIIIDTGISSAYGGVLSALEVIYTLTPEDGAGVQWLDEEPEAGLDGVAGVLAGRTYVEREEVFAIYERGRQRLALEVRKVAM